VLYLKRFFCGESVQVSPRYVELLKIALKMQFGHDGVSIRSGSSGGTLPAYSPRRSSRPSTARTEHASTVRTEHVYNRAPSGNSLTLKFRSDAHSASSTPTFSNLEQVPGRVELNVVNKSDILSVAVRIRCIYVTVITSLITLPRPSLLNLCINRLPPYSGPSDQWARSKTRATARIPTSKSSLKRSASYGLIPRARKSL
jgi:hypothetical protein